jgi:hypothetical protein
MVAFGFVWLSQQKTPNYSIMQYSPNHDDASLCETLAPLPYKSQPPPVVILTSQHSSANPPRRILESRHVYC